MKPPRTAKPKPRRQKTPPAPDAMKQHLRGYAALYGGQRKDDRHGKS